MRLLSVSRSFCSSIPEMGRYKLSRRGALPDFGRRANRELVPRRATQAEFEMESAASTTFKPKEEEFVLSASPEVVVRKPLSGPVIAWLELRHFWNSTTSGFSSRRENGRFLDKRVGRKYNAKDAIGAKDAWVVKVHDCRASVEAPCL